MSAMAGTQAQLSLRGIQDVYLLAPDNTFWKTTYARHTNFAVGEIEMSFNNQAGFGRQKFTCKLSKSGDLLAQTYIAIDLPRIEYPSAGSLYAPSGSPASYAYWTNAIGHAMWNEISVVVGQQQTDSHTGEYMEMFEALAAPSDRLMSKMTGRYSSAAECAQASLLDQKLYVPLKFWFNRHPEQALPLTALYWADVELHFSTKKRSELFNSVGAAATDLALASPTITVPSDVNDMHLLCNCVYLDKPERAAFANSKTEYVIDQVQYLGSESVTTTSTVVKHNCRFNHPVTELIWAFRKDSATAANDFFNFAGENAVVPNAAATIATDPFKSAQILVNNTQRTPDHPAVYYRTVQPWQAHARIPADDRMVYCYSFGLKPEELFHTGSINMSRFDSAFLSVTYNGSSNTLTPPVTGRMFIFARNKNVLKLSVGMCGVRFAA